MKKLNDFEIRFLPLILTVTIIVFLNSCNTGNTGNRGQKRQNVSIDIIVKDLKAIKIIAMLDSFPVSPLHTMDGVSETDSPVTLFIPGILHFLKL